MAKHRIFVYGTLRQGWGNHRIIENAEFIGKARTIGEYTLLDVGPFPAAYLHEQTSPIWGEVYEVDDAQFKAVERLEGYPNHYNRTDVMTTLGAATMYIYDHHRNLPVIESGDWADAG